MLPLLGLKAHFNISYILRLATYHGLLDVQLQQCPHLTGKISVFHSAIAIFYVPSDKSNIKGMRTECIHLITSWQKQGPQHDCARVVKDQDKLRIQGMSVVRIKLSFLFTHDVKTYT